MAVMNGDTITATAGGTQDWPDIPVAVSGQEYARRIDGDMSISGKISSKQWEELEEEVNKLKEANKMAQMGLYEVNVVNTKKNEEVEENIRVIAKDEDRAKMVALTEIGKSFDIDNCEFFVRCIGQWESKKPKEVKIVKE
ncbi:hypothetical protein LCGC14_0406600 [marine sediment metagenome]|uniref:Uncharacterized protein n=1 Tax=marine sediment metagenome TaxID=412755 RepID=A0A0F9SV11_9ZZZZ